MSFQEVVLFVFAIGFGILSLVAVSTLPNLATTKVLIKVICAYNSYEKLGA